MKYAILKKEDLGAWIECLKEKAKVYAPTKKEKFFVFRSVKNPEDVCLDYTSTILPPKKYYFPQKEKLLKFSVNPFKTARAIEEFKDFILFGVHTCDIVGIQCMDVVFRETPEDPNYLNRKEKMAIIGVECLRYCDQYATCASMGNNMPRGGYDLMMVDLGNSFIIHINSERGEKLVSGLSYFKEANPEDMVKLEKVREEKKKIFKEELEVSLPAVYEALDKSFDSAIWQDVGKRCVACGNCTAVCPTCYCFDVIDEMELSLNHGLRYRLWNSCQMDDFAKVAGNEDFRKGREARQKHRYYRKFKYSADKFNRYFCTGCGRCTRTCMAEINLKQTIKYLVNNKETK